MRRQLDEKVKCKACGGQLYVLASSACHDVTLIDVVVECDGCERTIYDLVDMDEMSIIEGPVKDG